MRNNADKRGEMRDARCEMRNKESKSLADER